MIKPGKIIVISGPTGSGESAITKKILETVPNTARMITATTRPPRPYEQDGIDYHFVSVDEFKKMIADNKILEYIQVPNRDVYYGTIKDEVETKLAAGINLIGNLGWPGNESFEKFFPGRVLSIFIKPDSLDVLKDRFIKRDPTISPEEIEKRLQNAQREMDEAAYYTHTVVNHEGNMDQAVHEVKELIYGFLG